VFRHYRRRLNLSYQSQPIWAVLTHSPFSFFFLFLLCQFYFLSFPRLFLAAYMCTSPGRKNTVLSASRWPKWPSSSKKTKWAPGPCANSQEIAMESMPVLPLEESCLNTLTQGGYHNYMPSLPTLCLPIHPFLFVSCIYIYTDIYNSHICIYQS
jgi:hypothetical protein